MRGGGRRLWTFVRLRAGLRYGTQKTRVVGYVWEHKAEGRLTRYGGTRNQVGWVWKVSSKSTSCLPVSCFPAQEWFGTAHLLTVCTLRT